MIFAKSEVVQSQNSKNTQVCHLFSLTKIHCFKTVL